MGHVQTVRGPVDPDDLGRVFTHEHLNLLGPGAFAFGGRPDVGVDLGVGALGIPPELGFRTLVDLTPIGLGRNPIAMRAISEASGMHIVLGASFYLEPYAPAWARDASLDELTDVFVRQATTGIDDTDIRIGILGEQATGLGEITSFEERALRAAARAHRATGLAINTHCTHGTMALEQLAILREEGVDLARVIVGHMDQAGLDTVLAVVAAGANAAYDTLGKEIWDFVLTPQDPTTGPEGEFAKRGYFRGDTSRFDEIAELVRRGHADRVFLSQDMTGLEAYLNANTHGTHGYAYLGRIVVPRLIALGVPEAAIHQMLVGNPARLLTVDD